MITKKEAVAEMANLGYSCSLENAILTVRITDVTNTKIKKLNQDLKKIGYHASFAIVPIKGDKSDE